MIKNGFFKVVSRPQVPNRWFWSILSSWSFDYAPKSPLERPLKRNTLKEPLERIPSKKPFEGLACPPERPCEESVTDTPEMYF